MKTKSLRLGAALALVLCSTAPATADSLEDHCSALASLTEVIATSHQREVPLALMLKALVDNVAREPTQRLVVMIYGQPRWSTKENQQIFINVWRDRIHTACLSGG